MHTHPDGQAVQSDCALCHDGAPGRSSSYSPFSAARSPCRGLRLDCPATETGSILFCILSLHAASSRTNCQLLGSSVSKIKESQEALYAHAYAQHSLLPIRLSNFSDISTPTRPIQRRFHQWSNHRSDQEQSFQGRQSPSKTRSANTREAQLRIVPAITAFPIFRSTLITSLSGGRALLPPRRMSMSVPQCRWLRT